MRFSYVLLSALLLATSAMAQQEATLHLMNNVIQSSRTNPALRPKNNVHVSFIPSFRVGVANSGFNYNSLASQVETDESGQKVLDIGKLYRNTKLSDRDYLNLGGSIDVFMLSFRSGKGRFSLNVTEHVQARLGYSNTLFKTIAVGNTPGETLDFGGYWLRGMHYREIGLGYNRKILDDKLVVGGRIKTLFGMANIHTKKADFSVATGADSVLYALTLQSDMLVQTAGTNSAQDDAINYITNTGNFGMGIDLGATYQYNEKITFSASILDLGFINWKEDVTNYRSAGSFEFSGTDNDGLLTGGGFEVDMTGLTDSIANTFEIVEDSASYRTGLPTKMYLTGYYRLAKNTQASATLYTDYIGSFRRSFTLGITQGLGRWLQAAATYSMQARSYNNLGLGLTVTTGAKGLQLHAITDNVLALTNPGGAKVANVRAGFNLVF